MRHVGLGLLLAASSAVAAPKDEVPAAYYQRLAATVRARLDAAVAAKVPVLVPPIPVKLSWKVAKVGSIDLGAPLVALTAGELDGDPKAAELYAVTPREVIALGYKAGKLVELARVAFSGERAVPESRDVVGTIVVEGNEIVAAASPWAKELRLSWSGKTLIGQPGQPGFLLCPSVRAQLAPGRNHFTTNTFETRCREDLVDPAGHPLRVRADLAMTGKLAVVVERCVAGAPCEVTGKYEYNNVGVAFAIADVDRDGTPDVVVSEASAPYATDSAKVHRLGGDDRKPVFRRLFNGGVAGLVVADGDDADDLAEVIAAVRLPGSTRVDVWRLD